MTDPINVSSLQQISNGLEEMQQQLDAIQKQAREQGNTLFMEAIQPLFDKYEFLGSVSWTQYTPYWNDGDECTFSSAHDYASLNSLKDIEDETEGEWEENGEDFESSSQEELYGDYDPVNRRYSRSPNPNFNPLYGECVETVHEFMKQFSDDMMEALFGDHASITVTRDGVKVEHCEHD